MKYMKRTNMYRAANVSFNPITMDGFSYSWWRFVGIVDGVLVFNNYRYSVSTGKHQAKVRSLMSQLGIEADLIMPVPKGLSGAFTLEDVIVQAEEHLCDSFLREQERNIERAEKARAKREREKALAAIEAAKPKLTLVEAV
jgi:hypothetical protein